MVKITTPEQNEEKLNEHQKIELENISKEELLKALENKQPKQLKEVALSLKLTKNLSNQIRVYSKLHDTSMTNSIEQIITRFFDNKTLTRDYFNPTNEVSISIPLESEIIDKYITGNINLMVDVTETNDKPSINPYDKQNNIINELPSYFNIMHIETINNSLDEYDPINECYYSNYHVGLNGKYQNKFLNHYGLIILETQGATVFENSKPVFDDTALNYKLIGIHSYNKEIIEVRLMTTKQCYELAIKVKNQNILNYFNNFNEYGYVEAVKRDVIDKWDLRKQIDKINFDKVKLQSENSKLMKENEELHNRIKNLRDNKDTPLENIILDEYYGLVDLNESKEQISKLQKENEELKSELNYLINVQEKRLDKIEKAVKGLNMIQDLIDDIKVDSDD